MELGKYGKARRERRSTKSETHHRVRPLPLSSPHLSPLTVTGVDGRGVEGRPLPPEPIFGTSTTFTPPVPTTHTPLPETSHPLPFPDRHRSTLRPTLLTQNSPTQPEGVETLPPLPPLCLPGVLNPPGVPRPPQECGVLFVSVVGSGVSPPVVGVVVLDSGCGRCGGGPFEELETAPTSLTDTHVPLRPTTGTGREVMGLGGCRTLEQVSGVTSFPRVTWGSR